MASLLNLTGADRLRRRFTPESRPGPPPRLSAQRGPRVRGAGTARRAPVTVRRGEARAARRPDDRGRDRVRMGRLVAARGAAVLAGADRRAARPRLAAGAVRSGLSAAADGGDRGVALGREAR